jgi:hypothetical protein
MESRSASDWIRYLELKPHPEGGYYNEVYRSVDVAGNPPSRFSGPRNFCTSIYYLLQHGDRSVFHRIKSDEIWHHYDGGTLNLYVLTAQGVVVHKLGKMEGELPHVVIPANHWFAARVESASSFVLAGCTVSPGFDFSDFELAEREVLMKQFPEASTIITELT